MIARIALAAAFLAGPAAAAPTIAELETRAAALAAEVTAQQDERDVERVQRAYGYYVDKSMWTNVADLFADDGTLEIGGRGVFVSKQRVFEYMSIGLGPAGPREGVIIDHQQLQPIVTIAPDGRTAKGRWRAFVMGIGRGDGVIGVVTYENEYVKQDGVWKIARLHAPFDMYTEYRKGWAVSAIPNTKPSSFPPMPDRPPTVQYETYPSVYLEPYHYPNPVTGR